MSHLELRPGFIDTVKRHHGIASDQAPRRQLSPHVPMLSPSAGAAPLGRFDRVKR